jgi:hypothetical protein
MKTLKQFIEQIQCPETAAQAIREAEAQAQAYEAQARKITPLRVRTRTNKAAMTARTIVGDLRREARKQVKQIRHREACQQRLAEHHANKKEVIAFL